MIYEISFLQSSSSSSLSSSPSNMQQQQQQQSKTKAHLHHVTVGQRVLSYRCSSLLWKNMHKKARIATSKTQTHHTTTQESSPRAKNTQSIHTQRKDTWHVTSRKQEEGNLTTLSTLLVQTCTTHILGYVLCAGTRECAMCAGACVQ